MNTFNCILAQEYYNENFLKNIQKVKIGIAGIGGLGSNLMNVLVRSGFCQYEIIDYDLVEFSNLNRQLFFVDDIGGYKVDVIESTMKKINPDIIVVKHKEKLNKINILNYFKDMDVIFEAFDKVEYKKIILEQFGNSKKIIISSSGMAGISNESQIRIRQINDLHYLVGDEHSEVTQINKAFAPRVIACASQMAGIILEREYNKWVLENKRK